MANAKLLKTVTGLHSSLFFQFSEEIILDLLRGTTTNLFFIVKEYFVSE